MTEQIATKVVKKYKVKWVTDDKNINPIGKSVYRGIELVGVIMACDDDDVVTIELIERVTEDEVKSFGGTPLEFA
jgi:hypothetical protein